MVDSLTDTSTEARLGRLEATLEGVIDGLNRITKAVEHLRVGQTEAQKTPWGVLVSFGTFMVVLVGGIGGLALNGISDNQERIERYLNKNVDITAAHVNTDGHPKVVSKIDANRNAIVKLDTGLQREMRDLDAAQISAMEDMDKSLQTEMKLLDKDTISIMQGMHNVQEEKIRALERIVFGNKKGVV